MDTLYLDPASWDLALDINGNIAVASEPYSLAQDVASYLRVFLGDIYYDQTQGIDFFGLILSTTVSITLLKATLAAAALKVPGVVTAQVFITVFNRQTRQISGQVQITDTDGVLSAASF